MKSVILALVVCALSALSFAQAPADPLENAWNVSVGGNFANITNAANNNGVQTVEELRVSQHLTARSGPVPCAGSFGRSSDGWPGIPLQPVASLGEIELRDQCEQV